MPSHEVGQLRDVCGSKSGRDALSLANRDITTATWGPELRAQHGTSGGSFPTLCRYVQ